MGLTRLIQRLRPVRFDEPVVVLDLETTGLNPRSDRILAIAAVPVLGRRIALDQRFVRLLHDAGPVSAESIRHHRLRPIDVRDGGRIESVLPELLSWIGERPIVGYATAFDIAFLSRAARRIGLEAPARFADVREHVRRRSLRQDPNRPPRLRFEQIAEDLKQPVVGRHDALGDAVSTALMWIALGNL